MIDFLFSGSVLVSENAKEENAGAEETADRRTSGATACRLGEGS